MNKIFILGILWIFLTSCSREVIWNAGEKLTRTVVLDPYHTIEFNGIFDVLLVQDNSDYVRITCGRNLLERVKVSQEAEIIEISEFSDMNWTRSYQRPFIELHFKQIQHLIINDCVNLESKGAFTGHLVSVWANADLVEADIRVLCDQFKLIVSEDNFGIYKVSGITGSSCLIQEGTAHFRMENLETDSCHVEHNGIGDCYVNAKRILEGKVTDKGWLLYKYYPSLRVNIDNYKGKVIPLSD